jgi:hypothetical protein
MWTQMLAKQTRQQQQVGEMALTRMLGLLQKQQTTVKTEILAPFSAKERKQMLDTTRRHSE